MSLVKGSLCTFTRIFRKVENILESDETPNEKQAANLTTCLEQIETKNTTIGELDTRINQPIEDPSALEDEILDVEEIQYNMAEIITLIKAVLVRPKPLNVQAPPFQLHGIKMHSQPQTDHQPQSDE